MLYTIIISANIMILIFIAYLMSIKKPEIKQLVKLNDEDFVRALLPFARKMRITEYGRGYNLSSLYPIIYQAYKQTERKARANIALFEYEKWLYQNLYLVKRFIYSQKRTGFKNLPHTDGEVRIIALARFIVNKSLSCLDQKRVDMAMRMIQNEVSLCFEEISCFNDAIGYALIEQIYILSQRILFHNRSKMLAQNGKISRKRMASDIYNYYLLKNNKARKQTIELLDKMGIRPESIEFNYNLSLTESTKMAESLFKGLMNYTLFVPKEKVLEYHNSNIILCEDKNYQDMNLETKLSYFSIIEKISEKVNISEVLTARKLMDLAEHNKMDIGTVLYDYPLYLKRAVRTGKIFEIDKRENSTLDVWYILTQIVLTLALSVGVWFWTGSIAAAIIGILPVFLVVEHLVNNIISPYTKQRVLPQMNYQTIPNEYNTMVVVSEYLTSPAQVREAVRHIIELRTSNIDENIHFTLLADFKKGDSEVLDTDDEMIAELFELKNYENCNAILRKRVYDGKKFSGFERKRGAIMALNRYLMTGNDEDFVFILNKEFRRPTFIMTLDADNTVVTGTIKDMINIITHPYNNKYDLINAHSRFNLYSIKTKYSKRFLNTSGVNQYPMYTGFFYNLFGKDVFCGKGIFRLKSFYNKLEGVFPSKKILSHDILEGSLLKTGSGATIFEDAPTSFLAERERRKRWQRGDIQLLPFIMSSWKNDENKLYKSSMGCFYKYLIFRNAFAVLKEFFIAVLALLSLFINPAIWKFVLALVVFPFVVNQFIIFQGMKDNIRMRYVADKTTNNFVNLIEEIYMLPYFAVSNFIIFIKTIIKMMTKGNLLEWKTYYQQQAQRKFASYVQEFTPTIVLVTLVGLAMFLLGLSPLYFLLFGIIVYGLQLALYFGSLPFKDYEYTDKEKKVLLRYAEKTYKYFSLMNSSSGIIGDNLQIRPFKGQSRHTSPTNIGFTFIADISAYYLGLIDREQVLKSINNRLQSIDIMPKWKGNLYNWYDIDSFKPLNNFVSSVDSGNLLAALMITKSFMNEAGDKNGYQLADKLISNTELEALYDYRKSQFYIGYNVNSKEFTGHYDLLASESRLMSLIFIARSGRVEHWRKLQRDYAPVLGNTLLSWSGTMFEYLMSDHFIEPPRFSLLYTTDYNAAFLQSKKQFKGLWGMSESGYYAFDDELRYQYYAFGLNKLALKNDYDKGVISPYSSALALKYLKKEALINLHKIDSAGGLGDYGFYEALDCSGRIRFISSYMTHHQGMILMAITNVLKDNLFNYLLRQNPCINGALNLLNELRSEHSYGIKKINDNLNILNEEKAYYENITKVEFNTKAAALSNGTMSVCFDTLGNNFVKFNEYYINGYRKIYGEHNGGYYYIIDDQKQLYSPSYYPLCKNINDYNVTCSDVEITLQNIEGNIKEDICIADGINAEVRRLTVKRGVFKNCKVGYYMDISLSDYDAFTAHPVFNNLFVNTSYDEETKAVIMHKKALKKEGDIYAAFIIRGLKDLKIETNRFNLLGRNGSEKQPRFFVEEKQNISQYPSMGDVLEPALGFIGEFEEDTNQCELITIVAKTKEELYSSIRILPDDFYSYAKESSRMKLRTEPIANKLLGYLQYVPYSNKTLLNVWHKRMQNRFRDLNNNKKSILYIYEDTKNNRFEELINAIRLWKKLGIEIRLIVYYNENFKETQSNHIREQLQKNFISDFLLIERNQNSGILFDLAYIVLDTDLTFNEVKPKNNILRNINIIPSPYSEKAFDMDECEQSSLSSGSGYYCDESYVLMKKPALPYSNVICDKHGGMVITENSGGFFYFDNSREARVTRYDFDPVKDNPFEYVLLKNNFNYHRINGGSKENHKTVYQKGLTQFYCYTNDYYTCVSNYLIYDGKAKVCEIDINVNSIQQINLELIYTLFPALSWKTDRDFICLDFDKDVISIHNLLNDRSCYIKAVCDNDEVINDINYKNEDLPYFEISLSNKPVKKIYIVASQDIVLLNSLTKEQVETAKTQSLNKYKNIGNIKIKSPVKSLNYIANTLLYQVYSSRIYGKCGYYQTGGATGFRDQLQDCLAFLHSDKEIVKNQILYSASHQYEEGDVMHWWHHPRFGIRTRITDDKLYLPYVVSIYVEYTGDYSILDTEIPYLKSSVLAENEHSRLENPPDSEIRESLLKHCIRAIKSSLRFGEHNLLLLGGGDWNDGLDHAGIEGRGESVALSMFCYEVLIKFKELCDENTKLFLTGVAEELKRNIQMNCYEDNQYKRLFTDDGKWLGAKSSLQYQVDLVAQSFAVLYGIAENEKAQNAIKAGLSLVDDNLGIIKLLSPPQTKDNYIGYISSYPQGIRENGGQYTHASVWFIMALLKSGNTEKAFELFQMINPVEKCRHKENNEMYKGEPYVFAGDIYFNKDNPGRMGWSWYTGSAAWAYRLIVEEFFGLRKRANKLVIQPNLPQKLLGTELIYHYKQSEYVFEFVQAKQNRILLDGVELENSEIELHDKKRSRVIVELCH